MAKYARIYIPIFENMKPEKNFMHSYAKMNNTQKLSLIR